MNFSDMSGQHSGWNRGHPKCFKSPMSNRMNNGFPMSYQSSRDANYVNTAPPTPGSNLWGAGPSCSSDEHNQQSTPHGKYRSQVQQTILPVLTTIVPDSNQPIPVLSSVRREKNTFLDGKKVKDVDVECNNNIIIAEESTGPALPCTMCVGNTMLGEEALRRHLKIHYDAMFKCGVCRHEKPSIILTTFWN